MNDYINAPLDWSDIKKSAAQFIIRYKKVTKEASYKQSFWNDFFKIFGIDAIQTGMYEYFVKQLGDKTGEIDYFWPGKLIIEHKSAGKNLDEAFVQAMNYAMAIEKKEEIPEYIIVSDFKRIRLHSVEGKFEPIEFKLEDLVDNIESFGFLAGYDNRRIEGQHPVNVKAAEVMGELYDHLLESKYPKEDLDILLIRLVFCIFAEDADIFDKNIFEGLLRFYGGDDGSRIGSELNELFEVLNTPYDRRQTSMPDMLKQFPYVNGGLFAKRIATPMFDREMKNLLLKAINLDWRFISPAIFGSLFQSIMDPAMRRELGAHYTSEENILKLIKPLFLDDLRSEFNTIKGNKKELRKFWDKIAAIRIMDPACGCGNFLIISYREMRRLEMDVLDALYEGQMIFDESHLFIDHYYGIEIGEFASMVANLSMILMDHLMNLEMRNRFGQCRDIIPLKEKANIICVNSLEYDWNMLVKPEELTYIVGNPPFVGAKVQTNAQRAELAQFFNKNAGILDYVSAWYVKATNMMVQNPNIKTALVSTNSITQGEQVEPLWKPLFDRGIKINFAYHTFKWNNEAKGVATVHVVIIGFSLIKTKCRIYMHSKDNKIYYSDAEHINAYLVDGPDVFLQNRTKPICDVPEIGIGNKPIDGGNYLFTEEEKIEFIKKEPNSEKYFRPWLGAREFIKGEHRYCLWLGDCTASELKLMPECRKRVEAVKEFREASKSAGTRKIANRPTRFHVENMSTEPYMVIPRHSSELREYLPIGFVDPINICGDANLMMTGVSLYHFGILESHMHMVWMKFVCGRLEMRYRYSAGIVYNNFPWPKITIDAKALVEEKAQKVLDARDNHQGCSFAELYDPLVMPEDLQKAHRDLDKVVEKLYNSNGFKDDNARIGFLFKKYNEMVN